jgi:hypothetical protein
VANDLIARHGNQRKEIIAVPPQPIHQICLQELPESPRIYLMDYRNVLWLFFADFDHRFIMSGSLTWYVILLHNASFLH